MMHPSLRIIALIWLAVAIQFLPPRPFVAAGAVVVLAAAFFHAPLLYRMVRRSRWLLLTLMLIYAYSTPGEFLAYWPFDTAPTYEGIEQGLLQAGRLLVMLAGLAILLGSTRRDALMAGIYFLIAPMRWAGICPERFTARLWLTLHYVEQVPPPDRRAIWAAFDNLDAADRQEAPESARYSAPLFRRLDWVILALLSGSAAAWLVS